MAAPFWVKLHTHSGTGPNRCCESFSMVRRRDDDASLVRHGGVGVHEVERFAIGDAREYCIAAMSNVVPAHVGEWPTLEPPDGSRHKPEATFVALF